MTLPQASTNSTQEAGDKERPQSKDDVCVCVRAYMCVRVFVRVGGWVVSRPVVETLDDTVTTSLQSHQMLLFPKPPAL